MTNNDDYDSVISLGRIGLTIRNTYYNYNIIKKCCENTLNSIISHKIGPNYKCFIYGIDCEKNIIKICLCDETNKYKKITFKVNDNNLSVLDSNSDCANKLIYYVGSVLLSGYKLLSKYNGLLNQSISDVLDCSGNYLISIDMGGININNIDNTFSIHYNVNDSRYSYSCVCKESLNMINGHEEDIFNNIFIKIDDLPPWLFQIANRLLLIESQNKKDEPVKLVKKRFSLFKKDKI